MAQDANALVNKSSEANPASFRAFFSVNRRSILLLLLVALALRVTLVVVFPKPAGDEARYRVPAVNMLAGHGFSSDEKPPITPSDHTVPLYPLFIAGVFAVFGPHNAVVRIAQSSLDLLTCLLVAFLAFSLAPPLLKHIAAIAALVIYGCLSWFTLSWNSYILTEILATFLTMLAVVVSIVAVRREPLRWFLVGAICGLALLTRADSLLLVSAFGLLLLFQIVRLRTSRRVVNMLAFCLAIPIVLGPWTIRNYVSLGKFQPLASPSGMPHGEYVPNGYFAWIRTWMTDQTHYRVYHPALYPGRTFDPRELPDDVFDSPEEKAQVFSLIDRYNREGKFTPEMNDEFQAIANERIKRSPMRFFVWLPLRRMTGMWLTGFATTNRLHRLIRILLVLPILIGGILGFALWARNPKVAAILLLVVSIRTIFFGFLNSDEHYIVEAYPPVIAACSVTVAALFSHAKNFLAERRTA